METIYWFYILFGLSIVGGIAIVLKLFEKIEAFLLRRGLLKQSVLNVSDKEIHKTFKKIQGMPIEDKVLLLSEAFGSPIDVTLGVTNNSYSIKAVKRQDVIHYDIDDTSATRGYTG